MRWGAVLMVGLLGCGRVGYDAIGGGRGDGDGDGDGDGRGDGGGDGDLDAAPGAAADASPDAPDAAVDLTFACARPFDTVPTSGLVTGPLGDGAGPGDAVGSCGGSLSDDSVYAVGVERGGSGLLVATDRPATTANTLVYVRSACDVGSSELVCDNDSGLLDAGGVRLSGLLPGPYYVFVDADAAQDRAFEALIQVLVPEGAPCDPASGAERCGPDLTCTAGTCQAAGCAVAQTFVGTGSFAVTAVTTGQPNLHAGSCGTGADGGIRAAERIYEVQLASAITNLHVSTDSNGTDFDTLIYVRAGCAGAEVGCDDDGGTSGQGTRSVLDTGPLAAGTYAIFIDGFSTEAGSAEVAIDVVP